MPPTVLAVLGGTSAVGREVVRQAVMAGNVVNVLSRSRSRAAELGEQVTFIAGDATDAAAVDRAIAPAEAVISLLAQTSRPLPSLLTSAMANAIAAMQRHDVSRIVVLSNLTVRAEDDSPTARQQLLSALARISQKNAHGDHRAHIGLLTASELDWTVVRAPAIVDRAASGRYRVGGLDATTGPEMGRADLAAFVLRCAVSGRHIRQMPVVSQPSRD